MELRLTRSVTENSTRNLPGYKVCPARVADSLTAVSVPVV
jgi:hypothetical protein